MKRKMAPPPVVQTLKRDPKASRMAQLLCKTPNFLMAKVENLWKASKETGNDLTKIHRAERD